MTPKEALKYLSELELNYKKLQYPNYPETYFKLETYSDANEKGIKKSIDSFFKFTGTGKMGSVTSTGRYINDSKMVTDVLGRQRTVGTGKWVKSSQTAGISDTICMFKGGTYFIEIKAGKDRMRESQKKFEESLNKFGGGNYVVVHTFLDFLNFYNSK